MAGVGMIVMKFGGTSIEDARSMKSAIEVVSRQLSRKPVIVASAIAGATNQLLTSAHAAFEGKLEEANKQLSNLQIGCGLLSELSWLRNGFKERRGSSRWRMFWQAISNSERIWLDQKNFREREQRSSRRSRKTALLTSPHCAGLSISR